jgi:hypothetical protein
MPDLFARICLDVILGIVALGCLMAGVFLVAVLFVMVKSVIKGD